MRAAEISEPSAANTRTWPTRLIRTGARRDPPRNPRKYAEMIHDMTLAVISSCEPRRPSSVPCIPLPTISSRMPVCSAHVSLRTRSIGRLPFSTRIPFANGPIRSNPTAARRILITAAEVIRRRRRRTCTSPRWPFGRRGAFHPFRQMPQPEEGAWISAGGSSS